MADSTYQGRHEKPERIIETRVEGKYPHQILVEYIAETVEKPNEMPFVTVNKKESIIENYIHVPSEEEMKRLQLEEDVRKMPTYQTMCSECKAKILYKQPEVSFGHIECPSCGAEIWVNPIAVMGTDGTI